MTRVLVVDDDSGLRSALRVLLRRASYEVDEARSGVEVLHKIGTSSYDVAVVDYQMPPPDGLKILGRLRELQPRCLRVLMSGALDLPVVMSAINRGEVARVLAKPFRRELILSTIEEAIAARSRLEELCVGARSEGFEEQRRHLEECFSDDRLTLALQPIVAATDETVRGYEALLRSRHDKLDTPTRILAAAETQQMLGRLADCVAMHAARWMRTLPPGVDLFLNMHPAELADVSDVQRRFAALQPWAERVVLEITERGHLLELTDWRNTLNTLTAAGFRFAVDDLGSGYNSLSILAEVQPAFVKVDMSIIRNIDREERKQRLVELVARFAKATNCQVIVEGVETVEEAVAVKRIGVDLLQGYLFGRPSSSVPGVRGPCAAVTESRVA